MGASQAPNPNPNTNTSANAAGTAAANKAVPLDIHAFQAAATLAQQQGDPSILHDFLKATVSQLPLPAQGFKAPMMPPMPMPPMQTQAAPVSQGNRTYKRLSDDPARLVSPTCHDLPRLVGFAPFSLRSRSV